MELDINTLEDSLTGFLGNRLSKNEYDALPETTGIGRKRLTRIEGNPQVATFIEIEQLSSACGVHPYLLCTKYKAGYTSLVWCEKEALEKSFLEHINNTNKNEKTKKAKNGDYFDDGFGTKQCI